MGAALKSLFDRENTVFIRYHSLAINKHLSKLDTPPWYVIDGRHPRIRLAMACVSKGWEECQIFYAISIWFQKLKSSSTWFNPCFPLRRAFLLLLCWVSFPIPSIFHKQTLVSTLLQHLLYATYWTYYIALCWQYPWDKYVESWSKCWNLNLPLCWLNTFC